MVERIKERHRFKIFFVESICDDPKIIEANILVSIMYFPVKDVHNKSVKALATRQDRCVNSGVKVRLEVVFHEGVMIS